MGEKNNNFLKFKKWFIDKIAPTITIKLNYAFFEKVKKAFRIKKKISKVWNKILYTLHLNRKSRIDRKEDALERLEGRLDNKEEQLEEQEEQLEEKEEQLEEKEEQLEEKEKEEKKEEQSLEKREKELSKTKKDFEKEKKDFEEKEKRFSEGKKDFEKRIKEGQKDFEKEKKDFEEKEKRFSEGKKDFEKRIKEGQKDFEKEKKDFEKREKDFKEREKDLETREKDFKEREKDLETREKDFKEREKVKQKSSQKDEMNKKTVLNPKTQKFKTRSTSQKQKAPHRPDTMPYVDYCKNQVIVLNSQNNQDILLLIEDVKKSNFKKFKTHLLPIQSNIVFYEFDDNKDKTTYSILTYVIQYGGKNRIKMLEEMFKHHSPEEYLINNILYPMPVLMQVLNHDTMNEKEKLNIIEFLVSKNIKMILSVNNDALNAKQYTALPIIHCAIKDKHTQIVKFFFSPDQLDYLYKNNAIKLFDIVIEGKTVVEWVIEQYGENSEIHTLFQKTLQDLQEVKTQYDAKDDYWDSSEIEGPNKSLQTDSSSEREQDL